MAWDRLGAEIVLEFAAHTGSAPADVVRKLEAVDEPWATDFYFAVRKANVERRLRRLGRSR